MSVNTLIKNIPFVGNVAKSIFYSKQNKNFPYVFEGKDKEILSQIQEKGYYVLEDYFSEEACDACKEAFIEVSKNNPEYTKVREDVRIFGAQNMCAEAMKLYKDPYLQQLSDAYYGQETLVGVMLANHVKEIEEENLGSGGDWHRDRYLRQFKALVYLDNVGEDQGPFQVIESSNTSNFKNAKKDTKLIKADIYQTRFTNNLVENLIADTPERLITFSAKKGTVVLVDTSAIHRGKPLKSGDRFAMFNYYYPTKNYNAKKMNEKFSPVLPENFKD